MRVLQRKGISSDRDRAVDKDEGAKYRVVIAMHSMVVREGLRQVLRDRLSTEYSVRFGSLLELEAEGEALPCTIVISPPDDGATLRRMLRLDQQNRQLRWLFVVHRPEQKRKWDVLLRRDNMSFVDLNAPAEEIVMAFSGRSPVSNHRPLRSFSHREQWPLLSHREWQVFILLGQGQRARQIGELLGIATPTVRNHLRNLYEKLGVQSRKQAIQRYQKSYE